MTSIIDKLKQQEARIRELERLNQEILDEYQKLDDKYFECLQHGKDKEREIARLNKLINTAGNSQLLQQNQLLQYFIRE